MGTLVAADALAQEQLPPAPVVPYVGPAQPIPQTEPTAPAGAAATLLPPAPFPIPVFPSPEASGTAPAQGTSQQEDQ